MNAIDILQLALKPPRCENCTWFVTRNKKVRDTDTGLCHRYPPAENFPQVYVTDWCGEFVPNLQAEDRAKHVASHEKQHNRKDDSNA